MIENVGLRFKPIPFSSRFHSPSLPCFPYISEGATEFRCLPRISQANRKEEREPTDSAGLAQGESGGVADMCKAWKGKPWGFSSLELGAVLAFGWT